MGLLAFFLIQHSRRRARVDIKGDLVSLDEQNRSLWDREMINEGRALLEKSLRHNAPGPYQIKAAIAAVHAAAPDAAATDWAEIERLYVALYQFEPTPVVKLNHAAAVAKVMGPTGALAMLEEIESALGSYRWFHTTRAAFFEELGDFRAARIAYERALLLGPTQPERRFIGRKVAECEEKI